MSLLLPFLRAIFTYLSCHPLFILYVYMSVFMLMDICIVFNLGYYESCCFNHFVYFGDDIFVIFLSIILWIRVYRVRFLFTKCKFILPPKTSQGTILSRPFLVRHTVPLLESQYLL